MNCQDIARILNERDVGQLTAVERARAEAHLAGCAECAGDWEVHERIGAAEIPAMPRWLRDWHPGRRASEASTSSRRRVVVVPLLLLAGATAAMFALVSTMQTGPDANLAANQGDSTATADDLAVASLSGNTEDEGVVAAETEAEAVDAPVVEPRHRLLILPPRHEVDNADAILVTEGVHRSLVAFFRTRPDLEVIEVSASQLAAAESEVDDSDRRRFGATTRQLGYGYSVRIASRQFDSPELWILGVEAELATVEGYSGSGGSSSSIETGSPVNVEDLGTRLAQRAYAFLLPDSSSGQLESIIMNLGHTYDERLAAIRTLVRDVRRRTREGSIPAELSSPAMAAAIELARSAPDLATRREIWQLLAQTGHPILAQPLTDALLYDADARVRETAAEALFAYLPDPVVRAALESARITDASPAVRSEIERMIENELAEPPAPQSVERPTR